MTVNIQSKFFLIIGAKVRDIFETTKVFSEFYHRKFGRMDFICYLCAITTKSMDALDIRKKKKCYYTVQRFKGSKVQNAKFIIDGMFKMYLYYIYIIIYI